MPDSLPLFALQLMPDNRINHHHDTLDAPNRWWWRYDAYVELGSIPSFDVVDLSASSYPVVRESTASVWVDYYGEIKRIGKDWGRKWAYPTKAEAFAGWNRRFSWRKTFHQKEARRIVVLQRLLDDNTE